MNGSSASPGSAGIAESAGSDGSAGRTGPSGSPGSPDSPGSSGSSGLGLYALKPWYARKLSGVRGALARREVSPDTLTAAGVACAAGAAAALAWLPDLLRPQAPTLVTTLLTTLTVTVLLAARLAFANLDGALARDTGRTTRRGALLNELGDRAADLVMLAGFLPLAPLWLVATAALAATLPSWVSLAGAAAGAGRLNGGPVGKTERCALVIVAAATGWWTPILVAVAAGSALTAVTRGVRLWRELGGKAPAARGELGIR
ncbi:CDP-alcohol phosphatidyltransferase family protein [Streptomyces lasiicapitis]|uniref:CDP-alcohol phosphatidyltransferase family protein n=1 Tax=Streptomyces lasiicapitis TaxID=1923961 RepID=UPI0036752009